MACVASNMANGHAVANGYPFPFGDHKFVRITMIDSELERMHIKEKLMYAAHADADVIFLSPFYADCETYCSFPPAPEDKLEFRDGIYDKLSAMLGSGEALVRHVDGNVLNTKSGNVVNVSHYEAFSNPDRYVDWVYRVTPNEAIYVTNHMEHFAELFKPIDPTAVAEIVWDSI